jgi:GAF domain-containing protein
MTMNFLRSLSPIVIPLNLDSSDELKVWQERILHTILLVGAFFGLLICLFSIGPALSTNNRVLFISSLLLAVVSIFLVILRRLSYWFRSISTLIVVFIFSNLIFSVSGWGGLALILLLGFSFLSTTFLYKRPSRIGIGISLTTLLFWAILRYTNLVSSAEVSSSINNILTDVLLMLLVGIIGNLTIASLKARYFEEHNKLNNAINDEEILKQSLSIQKVDLEKQLFKLRTVSEISQSISSIFDTQILLQKASELIKDRFELYYVGVFLIDNSREYAVLRYGTGEMGQRMLAARHRLAVGGYSMIGWTTQTRKSRVALDIGGEAVHFDNPLLPKTRSELALPIISGTNILGAMTVQSELANAFDENDILIFQSIADSLATALENATSFLRTQKALEDIKVLNRAYVKQAWWNTLDTRKDLKIDFENPLSSDKKDSGSTIKVPLILRDEVIGSFNLEIEGPEIPKEQLEFLETVSAQTSIALENARLLEETQLAAMQEQKLNDLTTRFSRALTIEEILKTAVMEFGKLPAVNEASISLLPPEEYVSQEKIALPGKENK